MGDIYLEKFERRDFLFPIELIKREIDVDGSLVARPLHLSDFERGTFFPLDMIYKKGIRIQTVSFKLQHRLHTPLTIPTVSFLFIFIGYLELLSQLTDIEQVTRSKFTERFREFQLDKDVYYIVVIEDTARNK